MSNSLIHLELKGQAATKLAECVSKAIGSLWKPHAMIREAKATAQANLILAQGEIEKARLMRAAERMAFLEDRRQSVIESIVKQAIEQLPENVSSEPVSEDWTVQFFESCKDVGDTEMQRLWAKILAGEVAKPGSYSRRTMNVLKTFERFDAEAFADYSSICFRRQDRNHIAFFGDATLNCLPEKYQRIGLESHLVAIGLVASPQIFGVSVINGWVLEHAGKKYRVIVRLPEGDHLDGVVSGAMLTAVGEELIRIVGVPNAVELVEALSSELKQLGVEFLPIE